MTTHDSIYELHIIDTNGNSYHLFGDADLKQVWEEYSEATFDSPEGKLVVTGFRDSAVHSVVSFALERGIIKGMILSQQ